MKKILSLVLMAALLIGCSERKQAIELLNEQRYVWENIRQYCMEEPEYAFALVDTAQMAGIADENYANWMRAQIYYGSKNQDLKKAEDCCMTILENNDPKPDSLQYVKVYSLLLSICKDSEKYQEALGYAVEGARIAHENGWSVEESDFYFEAGHIMELTEPGSGREYLERSLAQFRASSNPQLLPMFSSQLGTVARLAVNRGDYSQGSELIKERIQVIDKIGEAFSTAPKGYLDDQYAYAYSVLACCQYMEGDKEAASRSAQAFEQTSASKSPNHLQDILNYYVISGNGKRIQQIYSVLDPLYMESGDTISNDYASLLESYAIGLDNINQGHEAFKTMERHSVISDSLVQRERRAETLRWAQQMKTQEKEIQLKEKEAEARLHWVIIISLITLLVIGSVALWRIIVAHQSLREKNRQLYETVQQMIEQETKEQDKVLSEAPASASQQLYTRICQLMREQHPYTSSDLNRESFAEMLGTNYNAVAAAVREFSDGMTLGDFLDDWRIRHAAALLRESDEPIGLISEMSGFASRSHFSTLFREKFKLTPGEYRKVAREEA